MHVPKVLAIKVTYGFWSSFDDTPGPAILSSCSELLLNGGLFYAVLVEIEKPKLLQ